MHVVGTAGHVDHGKSTLIQALTGIHPDRLREEIERQMTIDLGFAWMTLPSGEDIGIVDVPGHRDFIENMLAGVGGIDAVLFVVAADEGVMPQTREHLAILNLLGVERGLIVLSKVDLVQDPEWLSLVEADLHALTAGTALATAGVVRVSAKTGAGLDELKAALARLLKDAPARMDLMRPRLPVDRVFSMPGFGTVVTGTLLDGTLETGQEVEVLPAGRRARVRGLQTHRHAVEKATPGSRVAANLSGVDVQALGRGDVVCAPGQFVPTRVLDVRFVSLRDMETALLHSQEVKLFLGTAQRIGRVRLLGKESLLPGEEGWLQLVLREPIVAARGDRFVLRKPSPGETIGGGQVADPHPPRLHKRRDPAVAHALERLLSKDTDQLVLETARGDSPISVAVLAERTGLSREEVTPIVDRLADEQRLVLLGAQPRPIQAEALVMSSTTWNALTERVDKMLEAYHTAAPLRSGMPREELKSRLGMEAREFNAVLQTLTLQQRIQDRGVALARAGYNPTPTPAQQAGIDRLLAKFREAAYAPPSVKEAEAEVGEEVFAYLLEAGLLKQVAPDVAFAADAYQAMVDGVVEMLTKSATVTVAQVRDQFNTSRKFVLALLEHMDAQGFTIREGDVRRLGRRGAGG